MVRSVSGYGLNKGGEPTNTGVFTNHPRTECALAYSYARTKQHLLVLKLYAYTPPISATFILPSKLGCVLYFVFESKVLTRIPLLWCARVHVCTWCHVCGGGSCLCACGGLGDNVSVGGSSIRTVQL